MIFITVGSQIHFNRLVKMVDKWAETNNYFDIVAQIGQTDYVPEHMYSQKFMTPNEYREHFSKAKAVVAHAGTGVTLTAVEFGVPLIMMPRLPELKEVRNNHQIDYLGKFASVPGIYPAYCENDLFRYLDNIGHLDGAHPLRGDRTLITEINRYILS